MPKWLTALLTRLGKADEPTLTLQRDLQLLRLELEEHKETIQRLKQEAEIMRAQEELRAKELVQFQVERLFSDIASPAAHILTQAHLLENEKKPVEAQDVLAVAKRLLRALADYGLKVEGRVQESEPFDSNRHEPLGEQAIRAGAPVMIQFVGFSFQGKVIRRAGVRETR